MTPSDIEVLLHYHVRPVIHPRADAPAVKEATENFVTHGLLAAGSSGVLTTSAGGKLLVDALCAVPFPIKKWVMPTNQPLI